MTPRSRERIPDAPGVRHQHQPIIDGQHPHDFFMELAAEYARPIGGWMWNNVITTGLSRGMWGIEASAFHGAEPDEQRWDLGGGVRQSTAETRTAATVGHGHLRFRELRALRRTTPRRVAVLTSRSAD